MRLVPAGVVEAEAFSKRYVTVSRTALNQRRQPWLWFHRSANRPLVLSRKKT